MHILPFKDFVLSKIEPMAPYFKPGGTSGIVFGTSGIIFGTSGTISARMVCYYKWKISCVYVYNV